MAARRKCRRWGYRKVIQDYGPAKRIRFCKSRKGSSKGGTKAKGWCVYKGKRKGRAVSCHKMKRAATRIAKIMRKTCKTRIRVKRAR